jgi:hypothetical protein
MRTLLLWLFACCVAPTHAAWSIEGNRYNGVVVAIHQNVEESQELLDHIVEEFTLASEYLFIATRSPCHSFYFQCAKVLNLQTLNMQTCTTL